MRRKVFRNDFKVKNFMLFITKARETAFETFEKLTDVYSES